MARTVQQGECRVWTGSINKRTGYGSVWADGRTRQAHVVSYEMHKGPIPAGLVILHGCDNRICINPAHLSAGTYLDNARDMQAKKRERKATGERHGMAKLTAEQIDNVRRRYRPYDRSNSSSALAREFGVHQSTIYAALSGKTWADVPRA